MTSLMDGEEEAGGADRPRPPGLTSAIVALLAASCAAFFYWIAQSSIAGLGRGDPAGNGLNAGFALLGEMLLWLCLGPYLIATAWRSGLARPLLAAMGIGWAAAAWSSTVAILVMDGAREGPTWLRLFPAILPWLAILLGLWVRAGRYLPPRTRAIGMAMLATLAAPLIIVPIVSKHQWDQGAPYRAIAGAAAYEAAIWELRRRMRASEAAEPSASE